MIKFSIENQKEKEEIKEPVQELKIGLRINGDDVCIVSLQENGTIDWYLLQLHSDGTFSREGSIERGVGFQLDNGDNQIKERTDDIN